jgi:hypothetical protein
MDYRHERVRLETARHRITGTLTLPQEGYRSRISDFLNAGDRDFVALTDVLVEQLDNGAGDAERHEFLAVARGHIVLVTPLEGR